MIEILLNIMFPEKAFSQGSLLEGLRSEAPLYRPRRITGRLDELAVLARQYSTFSACDPESSENFDPNEQTRLKRASRRYRRVEVCL